MELNGNCAVSSESVEDLSEYTDADESMSAPTEILAEFLSAVMLKDYETALKYCKMILQYEPNHVTAKEFYPLILEKLIQASAVSNASGDSSESSETSDDDGVGGESESSSSSGADIESCGDEKLSSDSDGTTASYSSLEDEIAPTLGPSKLLDNYLPPSSENGNPSPTDDSESPTEPVSQLIRSFARLN